ncbi:MAG: helix-turn-helix domain-containing protein [Planctomycetota bacterium]|jgi:hypothetical protein
MAEKKMYYSEEEAAGKLGVGVEQLTDYAREGKLQQYQDGPRKVYRASQVEELAASLGQGETAEIELTPAGDTNLGLSDSGIGEGTKEGTAISNIGISIFDDEDLGVEVADPMAKTQISPSLEEQIALEGTGSGSGLLDLTRESDDTSLGAEVLDHIDMESSVAPGLGEEAPAVEAMDASAGLFSGLIVGATLVTMVLTVAVLAAMSDQSFALLETLKNQLLIVFGGAVVAVIACGAVGMMLGKSIAARHKAVGKAG